MITNTLPALAADALPWTAAEAAKLRLNNRTCISSRSGSNSTLWASSSSTVRPSTLRTSSIFVHPLSRNGVGNLILQHAPLYVKSSTLKVRKIGANTCKDLRPWPKSSQILDKRSYMVPPIGANMGANLQRGREMAELEASLFGYLSLCGRPFKLPAPLRNSNNPRMVLLLPKEYVLPEEERSRGGDSEPALRESVGTSRGG